MRIFRQQQKRHETLINEIKNGIKSNIWLWKRSFILVSIKNFLILFKMYIKLRQALCTVVKVYLTSPTKNIFNSSLWKEKFKVFTLNCPSPSIKQHTIQKRNNLGEGKKESFIKYKLFLSKQYTIGLILQSWRDAILSEYSFAKGLLFIQTHQGKFCIHFQGWRTIILHPVC